MHSIMCCSSIPIHSSKWLAGEGHRLFKCEHQSPCLRESCTMNWDFQDYSSLYHAVAVGQTTITPTPCSPFPPQSSTLFPFLLFSSCFSNNIFLHPYLQHFSADTYLILPPPLLPPHYLFLPIIASLVPLCVSFPQPLWYLERCSLLARLPSSLLAW